MPSLKYDFYCKSWSLFFSINFPSTIPYGKVCVFLSWPSLYCVFLIPCNRDFVYFKRSMWHLIYHISVPVCMLMQLLSSWKDLLSLKICPSTQYKSKYLRAAASPPPGRHTAQSESSYPDTLGG